MDWKRFGKKLLFPPGWIIVIGTLLSAAGLIAVFVNGWDVYVTAVAVYVVSFYSLIILCAACIKTFPGYYRNAKEKVYENKYASRYFSDKVFKTHVNLYRSLWINLLYVVTNIISAVIFDTNWFGIFAVYYAVMAVMRFLLVRYARKNPIGKNRLGELKRARFCACILLTVNLILSGVILMMVYHNRGFEYQGFLIYVMALYTFYITTTAIVDMVKYRKYKSPVMTMSVIIKLASALFSMLFLENAMFAQFGAETPEQTKKMMIMATGAGISVVVVTIAVHRIVCTTRELKEIKGVNSSNGRE